jgi:prolactin regulatory element-binding protein
MAPSISFTKTTLTYPVGAAAFDPYRGYLVVAGGGGAGRSGVGNKISLLDVTSRQEISALTEIELSKDEDAVTSLAGLVGQGKMIAFAGLNSSDADKEKDKNEHFRSYLIEYPKRKAGKSAKEDVTKAQNMDGKITFSGKTRLFTTPSTKEGKLEAYQRILRLSRTCYPKRAVTPGGTKKIGAIASSLANKENEVVIFDATVALPTFSEVIQRIKPQDGLEANDVDIIEAEDGDFLAAYCLDHDVFLSEIDYDFSKRKPRKNLSSPRKVYSIPFPDVFEKKGRAKIRSIRFLTEKDILLVANLPGRSGVELLVLRLYSRHTIGTITLRKRLPGHVKAAVDLDTCSLDADERTGERQIVIAVASADLSISVLTIDYRGVDRDSLSNLRNVTTLRNVHDINIAKILFQPFLSPWSTVQPGANTGQRVPGPQFLKLASTSFANTVVVDSFPLMPSKSKTPGSRYILTSGRDFSQYYSVVVAGVALLVGLLLFQSFIGYQTGNDSVSLIPENIRNVLNGLRPPGEVAYEARRSSEQTNTFAKTPPVIKATHRLRDLLDHRHKHSDAEKKAIIVRGGGPDEPHELSTEVHADPAKLAEEHEQAKRWEELTKPEKEKWKDRLVKAGAWAVDEGETVLKGIFFSEYAGFVGQVVQEAIHG